VQGDEDVAALLEPVLAPGGEPARALDVREQRVDHRVADERDQLVGDALGPQVLVPVLRVRQEERGQVVGHAPVVLLRHRPVEAAQPRLEVADRDLELRRRERAGERRVHVARHDHEVWLEVDERLLEPFEGACGLEAVRARADAELQVRRRQRQLREEDVVDLGVVVLPRVDEALLDDAAALELGVDGRDLHVVGAGPDDVADELALHDFNQGRPDSGAWLLAATPESH
jgi:hypothetical protein